MSPAKCPRCWREHLPGNLPHLPRFQAMPASCAGFSSTAQWRISRYCIGQAWTRCSFPQSSPGARANSYRIAPTFEIEGISGMYSCAAFIIICDASSRLSPSVSTGRPQPGWCRSTAGRLSSTQAHPGEVQMVLVFSPATSSAARKNVIRTTWSSSDECLRCYAF